MCGWYVGPPYPCVDYKVVGYDCSGLVRYAVYNGSGRTIAWIPKISIEIRKYGHSAIRFGAGFPDDLHVIIEQVLVVALKVIGLEEEEYAPTGLVAYARGLFVIGGSGQEQVAAIAARRGNDDPTFGRSHGRVFDKGEMEFPGVEF
ncbi:hypothetical protein BGZ82_005527 [Podila clonocystis]|nr:hypothetical protein BGZ82_005527 [Podila clonocystis]